MSAKWRAGGAEGRPSPKDEWRTPPEFYAGLDERFGFQLDAACSSENCLAPRGLCRDLGCDGLAEPWAEVTWCNPPYSRVRPWLEKAVVESAHGVAVLLVPADVSTRWWIDLATLAAEVWFVSGRLRFLREDGSDHRTKRGGGGLTGPSAALVYRPRHRGTAYGYLGRDGRPVPGASN